MEYEFTPIFDDEILVVIVTGEVTFDDLFRLLEAASDEVKKHGFRRILTDARQSKMILTTLEIYEYPGSLSSKAGSLGIDTRSLKRAVVIPAVTRDNKFFETVSANKGQNQRMFLDYEEARNWLIDEE